MSERDGVRQLEATKTLSEAAGAFRATTEHMLSPHNELGSVVHNFGVSLAELREASRGLERFYADYIARTSTPEDRERVAEALIGVQVAGKLLEQASTALRSAHDNGEGLLLHGELG